MTRPPDRALCGKHRACETRMETKRVMKYNDLRVTLAVRTPSPERKTPRWGSKVKNSKDASLQASGDDFVPRQMRRLVGEERGSEGPDRVVTGSHIKLWRDIPWDKVNLRRLKSDPGLEMTQSQRALSVQKEKLKSVQIQDKVKLRRQKSEPNFGSRKHRAGSLRESPKKERPKSAEVRYNNKDGNSNCYLHFMGKNSSLEDEDTDTSVDPLTKFLAKHLSVVPSTSSTGLSVHSEPPMGRFLRSERRYKSLPRNMKPAYLAELKAKIDELGIKPAESSSTVEDDDDGEDEEEAGIEFGVEDDSGDGDIYDLESNDVPRVSIAKYCLKKLALYRLSRLMVSCTCSRFPLWKPFLKIPSFVLRFNFYG